MEKLIKGYTYKTEGADYTCMGTKNGGYVLQRVTDGWTLTAYNCQFDDNGKLYWGYSGGGNWPKKTAGNPTLYFFYRSGSYNKTDSEICYWCRTDKYSTKAALLNAYNPSSKGWSYPRKVAEVLTADQLLEKYPSDASRIISDAYRH